MFFKLNVVAIVAFRLSIIGCLLMIIGCGHESKQNELAGMASEAEVTLEANPNIKNLIAFDVLGGVFSLTSSDVEAIITNSENSSKNFSTGKANSLSEPLNVDSSFSFIGKEGRGSLTLITSGKAEKKLDSSTTPTVIGYHFAPLNLRFLFFNYAYDNGCLGMVRLDGEIDCAVEGDYDLTSGKLIGKAACNNGPAANPASIIYVAPDANYSVELNAVLTINGNPYMYKSYKYTGEIRIDGEPHNVETLIADGLSCQ